MSIPADEARVADIFQRAASCFGALPKARAALGASHGTCVALRYALARNLIVPEAAAAKGDVELDAAKVPARDLRDAEALLRENLDVVRYGQDYGPDHPATRQMEDTLGGVREALDAAAPGWRDGCALPLEAAGGPPES